VEGDIENLDGKMVITRIRVRYHLTIPKGKRGEAERALAVHENGCPAAVSVKRGIEIEYAAEIEEVEEE